MIQNDKIETLTNLLINPRVGKNNDNHSSLIKKDIFEKLDEENEDDIEENKSDDGDDDSIKDSSEEDEEEKDNLEDIFRKTEKISERIPEKEILNNDSEKKTNITSSFISQANKTIKKDYNSFVNQIYLVTLLIENGIEISIAKKYPVLNLKGYTENLKKAHDQLVEIITEIDPLAFLPNQFQNPWLRLAFVFSIPAFFIIVGNIIRLKSSSSSTSFPNMNSNYNENNSENEKKYQTTNSFNIGENKTTLINSNNLTNKKSNEVLKTNLFPTGKSFAKKDKKNIFN